MSMPTTLQEEIERLVRLHGGDALTAQQIGLAVNAAGGYGKGRDSFAQQIHARAKVRSAV